MRIFEYDNAINKISHKEEKIICWMSQKIKRVNNKIRERHFLLMSNKVKEKSIAMLNFFFFLFLKCKPTLSCLRDLTWNTLAKMLRQIMFRYPSSINRFNLKCIRQKAFHKS